MSPRPGVGITGEEALHAASEVGLGSLEDDVQVVGHNDEGEYAPGTAKCGLTEVFLKPITIDVIRTTCWRPLPRAMRW